jgi:hypothetical protein
LYCLQLIGKQIKLGKGKAAAIIKYQAIVAGGQ